MRDTKENAWMRWWIGWRVFACLMVLLVGAVVMFAGPLAPGDAARFWSAWTAFALWTAAAFWIPRDRLIARVSWSLAYFVVGWGLWIVMLGVHPVAYALAGVLFPYVSVLLRTRWAIPATIVQVGVMVFNPEGGAGVSPKTLVLFAVIAGPSVMLMLFIDSVIRQSEERKRWIGTLEAAQRDLARSERRAGILEERQRLAQQIHDSVAQGFIAVVTHLEAAQAVREREKATEYIDRAKTVARDSLDEARRLVWDLRPDLVGDRSLRGEDLVATLRTELTTWCHRSGTDGDVVVTGPIAEKVGAAPSAAVLQAAREGLQNVERHAAATKVHLVIQFDVTSIVLTITDDGVGIDREAASADLQGAGGNGFGLRALTEQVTKAGGTINLQPTPGRGTMLTVIVPTAVKNDDV